MLWSKKWRKALCLLLCTVFFVSLSVALQMPFQEAFQGKIRITQGYSVRQGTDGAYYVLDNGHERLICFDRKGRVRFVIENLTDAEGDTLYIDDFFVSGDGIYLSVTKWDKMRIMQEKILFYDANGRYAGTFLERDYSEYRTNKHRFYGINEKNGIPRVAECYANSILAGDLKIPYPNAFHAVSDVVFVDDRLYVLNKNGTIRMFVGDDRQGRVVYSLSTETDKNVVPYKLAAGEDGEIYFTDIRNCAVRHVDMIAGTSEIAFAPATSLTVHFTTDEALLLVDDSGVHVVNAGQTQDYVLLMKNVGMILSQIVWVVSVAISGGLVLGIVLWLLCLFFRKKRSASQLVAFWVVIAVTAVSLLLCGLLLNAFEQRYRAKIEEQVESAAYMVANQISGRDIERIEETGGFGGAAYNRLLSVMQRAFSTNIAFYGQLHCNVLKLSEHGGKGYAVAYLDQSVGAYFPLNSVEQDELKAVYETGAAVWNQAVSDVSGTYLSVKVPVLDGDGIVKGAVAVGVETYVITDMLRELVVGILMSIIIILMLVYLVSVEVMSFVGSRDLFVKSLSNGDKDVLPGHLLGLLVFLIFAAYNMTATFLPVYLIRKTDIFPEGLRKLAGALPITINILVIGVMSLFCAKLVRTYGIRKMILFAAFCSLAGNLLIYLFPGFFTICIGLVLDGIGVGSITNGIYVLLTYLKEEKNRTLGLTIYNGACLSGINFGMILGSLLAVMLGQRAVFGVVSLVWLFMVALSGLVLHKMEGVLGETVDKKSRGGQEAGTGKFLLNRQVLGFLVLIQNPNIMFGSFLFYYVPIYCDAQGYGETICSLLIMLYSQVAVLCADKVTKWISQAAGNYAVYAALFINTAALAAFALCPDLKSMAAVLVLMGIGASFGKTVQQNYYLCLKEVNQYGADKAMGVYNFSENIGESLGPVVFGRLMAAARFSMALGAFCGVVAGLGVTHFLVCGKELGNGQSEGI